MNTLRRITQICGFVISHAYLRVFSTKQIYQGPLKAICVPFFTCHACPAAIFSCPIGTIQHYMVLRQFPWVLFGNLFLILITVGRMVCGWLCPVGLVQDLMYKIKVAKVKLPHWLYYLKYPSIIFLVIFIPYFHSLEWFCKICPPGTLEAAIPWVLWNPINPEFQQREIDVSALGLFFVTKIIIFLVFVWLTTISKRAFCRILCPLGVIFSVFNRFSIIRMKVDNLHPCNPKCTLCLKNCPMDIKISDNPNSGQCIRCLKCTICKKVKIGIGDLNSPVLEKA